MTPPDARPPAPESEPLSFEQALERLETIVEQLEAGSLTLEDSIKQYEEGMKLSRRLSQTLDEAEHRIERLTAPDDGGADPTESPEPPDAAPRTASPRRGRAEPTPRDAARGRERPGVDELPF